MKVFSLQYWFKWLLIVAILMIYFYPCLATVAAPERTPLTLTLLQERLANPVLQDGISTIDLHNFTIDLSDKNSEFREQFYLQIQTQLNRAKHPLGLDFSYSLFQGQFIAQRLGLPTSLSKGALPLLLTPTEQQILEQDEQFLLEPGGQMIKITVFRGLLKLQNTLFMSPVDFSKIFFLQRVEAINATFTQDSNWVETRFGRAVDFSKAIFGREANFSQTQFLGTARFRQVQFRGVNKFYRSHFKAEAFFDRSDFNQFADFTRTQWRKTASFTQVLWRDRSVFSESRFSELLSFNSSTFEEGSAFRSSYFNGLINFQDVKLVDQIDFSNAIFSENASFNVAGLAFDSNRAKILGDRGVIGKIISLPSLESNEAVLNNLVRNFRSLEQIPDANQIEYTKARLRLKQLSGRVLNLSFKRMINLTWLKDLSSWGFLAILLLLSNYGTNVELVLGTGIVIFAYFGFLFWLIDRYRRITPKPIMPERYDIILMTSSYLALTLLGIFNIFNFSSRPWVTLMGLAIILIPLPLGLVIYLYRKGRYHDLMEISYFVMEGSLRQLRLLIVRLPIIPDYQLFRERYTPLVWSRHWNWLNYYDLSLNNLIKLGFNDIRLRDEHLPGIVAFLVWYEWGIGVFYIVLLFWTLSHIIPGLNLLIYLR